MSTMDAVWTAIVALAVVNVTLIAAAVWAWSHTVRWSQVERVKITLAEQEEALSSLFDKINTMLARWRKREQREASKEPDTRPTAQSTRKAALRRRAAELRGLPHSFSHLELSDVSTDQEGTSN